MIYIDFYGGLHGHFLEYSINALDDEVKKSSPFTTFGTSHKKFPKPLATANHYSSYNIPIKGDIISITATEQDCLIVNLLNMSRSGDYNFNLYAFEKNLGPTLRNTPFYHGFRESLLHYGIDLDVTDSVPRGTLRESLKFNFLDPIKNSFMQNVYNMKYVNCGMNVYFRSLYNTQEYISMLHQVVECFKLPYKIDEIWFSTLLESFLKKLDCVETERDSLETLHCVIDLTNKPIEFNIVQEAWLNAELENRFGIEMPFAQEQYFTDANSINRYLQRL
jgi:hypothetical protein